MALKALAMLVRIPNYNQPESNPRLNSVDIRVLSEGIQLSNLPVQMISTQRCTQDFV